MASPCRFCLEHTQTNENPLIQPCNCKGSVINIHLVCLVKWRKFTENPLAKYKCQLCNVNFNFPTRWLRQHNLLPNSLTWYILQKAWAFIILVQLLHIHGVNQLSQQPSEIIVLQYYFEDYNTLHSIQLFQYLLLITTSVYLGFYGYLLAHVTEKLIYLRYAFVKQFKMVLVFIILTASYIGTYTILFPFSYIYILFLPHVITLHDEILTDMNTDCEIIKYM